MEQKLNSNTKVELNPSSHTCTKPLVGSCVSKFPNFGGYETKENTLSFYYCPHCKSGVGITNVKKPKSNFLWKAQWFYFHFVLYVMYKLGIRKKFQLSRAKFFPMWSIFICPKTDK
jgi:hypothetical protein